MGTIGRNRLYFTTLCDLSDVAECERLQDVNAHSSVREFLFHPASIEGYINTGQVLLEHD